MLHILNSSPWQCDINEMLLMIRKDDDLLLMQNGVIGALIDSKFTKILTKIPANIFALREDVDARGISISQISDKIKVINYTYFVYLVVKHTNQINW